MNLLIKAICFLAFILLMQQGSHASSSDDIVAQQQEISSPASDSFIRMPEMPPLFLISKQESGVQILGGSNKGMYSLIPLSKQVPRNFNFRTNLELTAIIIDHEAPVPLFIEGHALRQ